MNSQFEQVRTTSIVFQQHLRHHIVLRDQQLSFHKTRYMLMERRCRFCTNPWVQSTAITTIPPGYRHYMFKLLSLVKRNSCIKLTFGTQVLFVSQCSYKANKDLNLSKLNLTMNIAFQQLQYHRQASAPP